MTLVGLQYQKQAEDKRHNLVTEAAAVADRQSRESIASLDRASREDVALQDRISRESISSADRQSRESVATQDRQSRENVASLDRTSREQISANQIRSNEQIAADKIAADRLLQTLKHEHELAIKQEDYKRAEELKRLELEANKQLAREANLTKLGTSVINGISRLIPSFNFGWKGDLTKDEAFDPSLYLN